jgi:hypothetical protein
MKKVNHGKISRDTICAVKQVMPSASRLKAKAFEGCAMMAKSFQFENLKQNSGKRLACPVRVARSLTRKSQSPANVCPVWFLTTPADIGGFFCFLRP